MEPNGRRLDSTVNQVDLAPWRANPSDNQTFVHYGTPRRTTLVEEPKELMNLSSCGIVLLCILRSLNVLRRSTHCLNRSYVSNLPLWWIPVSVWGKSLKAINIYQNENSR